jgi:transposase, IS30 family
VSGPGRFRPRLSFAEREEIALLRARDFGVRAIARRLGRSPSTISRELRRNASMRTYRLEHRASPAQWHAGRRAQRPKTARLVIDRRLHGYVQDRPAGTVVHAAGGKVVEGPQVRPWQSRNKPRRQDRRWATAWSPEQISQHLKVDFPEDGSVRISPEAIHQALYVQGRGALQRELVACPRTGRSLRVPRERTRQSVRGHVTADVLISERPAEAEDRAVPGHREGDLIIGTGRSAIGTPVERRTRFTMLLHLPRMEGLGTEPRTKNGPALAGRGAEAVNEHLLSLQGTGVATIG